MFDEVSGQQREHQNLFFVRNQENWRGDQKGNQRGRMGPPLSRGLRGRCGIRAERSGCSATSTPPSATKNKEKMTTGTRSTTDHRSDRQSILDELESGGRLATNLRARTEGGEVGRLGESSEGGHRSRGTDTRVWSKRGNTTIVRGRVDVAWNPRDYIAEVRSGLHNLRHEGTRSGN